MGLLQLGMTTQVLRVILGLLTTFSGFEILYAAMEGSSLVAALLVVINLGLGLVGAYFLTASSEEKIVMSAPFIWIFIPMIVGGLSLFVTRERMATIIGGVTAIILVGAALFIPIDEALGFGSFSVKVASSFQILGRSLTLDSFRSALVSNLIWSCRVMVRGCGICWRGEAPHTIWINYYQFISCIDRSATVSLRGSVD